MNYSYPQIVLQEVPGEISLALSISGCPLRCKGCHSKETYDESFGSLLTYNELSKLITKHVSCVLFYGGEWNPNELKDMLKHIKDTYNIKTCLYSGFELEYIHDDILKYLDYIKTGPYNEFHGGLNSKSTNQKFFKVLNGIPTILKLM